MRTEVLPCKALLPALLDPLDRLSLRVLQHQRLALLFPNFESLFIVQKCIEGEKKPPLEADTILMFRLSSNL